MKAPGNAKELIDEIEHAYGQKLHKYNVPHNFQLEPDVELISNLSGNYGALFIRALLGKLGLNEHHLFKWRLEHKLNQFYVLNHYCPGCMPETLSLASVLSDKDGLEKIKSLLNVGFFIKATLGDASLANNNWDRTGELNEILKIEKDTLDSQQPYILQKKLQLDSEYRIHTFCRDIIPGLTFTTQGSKKINIKLRAEIFLKQVLDSLPNSITNGALIAWDVGYDKNNGYAIIEANFTGYHPEYRAGFQTTGYVDNHKYGPIICAWLNIYFKTNWKISVNSINTTLYNSYPFYQSWTYYNTILHEPHLRMLQSHIHEESISAVIYVDDSNIELMKRLMAHFLLVDFVNSYELISPESIYAGLRIVYWGSQLVRVFSERELVDEAQATVVSMFSQERQRQVYRFHLVRKQNLSRYIFI